MDFICSTSLISDWYSILSYYSVDVSYEISISMHIFSLNSMSCFLCQVFLKKKIICLHLYIDKVSIQPATLPGLEINNALWIVPTRSKGENIYPYKYQKHCFRIQIDILIFIIAVIFTSHFW